MSSLTSFPDYEKFVELQPNFFRATFPLKLFGITFPVSVFLIRIPSTKDFILIDSGAPDNVTKLSEALSSHFQSSSSEYKLKYVAITHGHFDHTGSLPKLLDDYKDVKIIMGENEIPFVVDGKKYREIQGDTLTFQLFKNISEESDVILKGYEDRVVVIKEGKEHEFEFYDILRPIFTVGHTPGSLSYLHIPTNRICVGDLIYNVPLIPILSTRNTIQIVYPSTSNVSNCKESIKKISQMEGEVKEIFPAHNFKVDGISMEEFKRFAQSI